ncbi:MULTISPECIES: ParB/RepB/Spo0J family partition protein [Pseudanabaena]|jgi:ParB family transcriptional regulator, chromosome partitioning protein|uniref:ParB/RepB/Spo0J family partition protein n=1 Tax=Pseudanabaena TaxID=1152 RepID=UPI00247A2FFC|nr:MULTISPECIES: ParB/RepB/Spo0J family partition protein [Pseudanabaena]MEA5488848.1 ParB/RepB/Spo0J family partition protein [Pseudanabaena sp. CCNP1317]WGS74914.1 ParB/RepB/Spo0J family partition protein [Pseudanabaena galeata CCNP1313]
MAARKAPNIADYFSGAKQTQQLSNAEEEIAQLKTEIERLRASGSEEVETQLSTLKEQLKSQSGVVDLEITQIIQNPDQPRRTFLNESIEAMSQSLASDGQLSPIIVIAQEDENYLLFDGERRWRAAKDLGWSTIKAVTMDEPKDLHRKALLTSLHREDLNPLDKAEAIIKEISLNAGLKADDIPRVLSTVIRRLNKQKRLSEVMANLSSDSSSQNVKSDYNHVNESEQAILKILLELQLNPASVDANLLPMLGLADDLKDAIRNLGLKGVHAIALQKLSAKNLNLSQAKAKRLREDLTKKVVQENLSVLQTRKLVNQAIAKYSPSTENAVDANKQLGKIKQSVDLISSDLLRSADPTSLRDVYDLLKQKMTEIESLIS